LLGIDHPDYLAERLTPRQLADWADVYAADPWGEQRADMRMARTVWAIFQSPRKQRINERDYLFTFSAAEAAPQTPEEYQSDYRAKAHRMYALQNQRFKR